MRIEFEESVHARATLRCIPEEYDATPPVSELYLDCVPVALNPERLAIAAYLAFGHWASGDFQLPRKLGPNTAAAIERDLSHVSIRPGPIEYYPKPLEVGIRDIDVSIGNGIADTRSPYTINIYESSGWNGALRSLNSISVSSNAFAIDAARPTTHQSIRAQLAVAVMLAAELSADRLVVNDTCNIQASERRQIESLLLASRLGICFR